MPVLHRLVSVEVDEEHRVFYVSFSLFAKRGEATRSLKYERAGPLVSQDDSTVVLDYNANGELIGIEVLNQTLVKH